MLQRSLRGNRGENLDSRFGPPLKTRVRALTRRPLTGKPTVEN
jgi:hypothetical protein